MSIVFTSGQLHRYNGGTKVYNVAVQTLRAHGYDAYIATQDGTYEPWLVNHQPVISYEDVRGLQDAKVVTTWLATPGLDALLQGRSFYYYDLELMWTLHFRGILDAFLTADRIAGIATNNRYMQAWYMATYGIMPTLIHQWCDTDIFYPDAGARVQGRIGCMPDDPGSRETHERLQAEFGDQVIVVCGDEQQVVDTMRTVAIFAGINPGKHPLWGEGFANTQLEAMCCGCAVVAFDILGNREYICDGWNGILIERGDTDGMIEAIHRLLNDSDERERLAGNGVMYARGLFTEAGKVELLRRWLEL